MGRIKVGIMVLDRRKDRGISIVIGGALFFAIVFSTLLSYSLVISETTHDYNLSALEKSSNDRDRATEKFAIQTFSVSGKIGLTINNTGGLPISIIGIFISNSTHQFYYNATVGGITPTLPHPVNPRSSSAMLDTGLIFVGGQVYEIKALSSRGQIAIGEFPERATSSAVFSTIAGLISLEIATLEWAHWEEGETPSSVTWSKDPEVPKGKDLVWRGVFVNHHTEDLYLRQELIVSVLNIIPDSSENVRLYWWYIIKTSDFTAYTDFSQTIPAGGSATITLGSKTKGVGMSTGDAQDIDFDGEYKVSIIVHGRWGSASGANYGQNIAYGAIIGI